MAKKVFVLGKPGSGKSTVARHSVEYVKENYPLWHATHLNDYGILLRMFLQDTTKQSFCDDGKGGFIIKNPEVRNQALKCLEEDVNRLLPKTNELIIIEFARSNYREVFKQFSPGFLKGAYFFLLDANIDSCKQRVQDRANYPETKDDYYISDIVFSHYENDENWNYLQSYSFRETFEVPQERIEFLWNMDSLASVEYWVHSATDKIFRPAPAKCEPVLAGTLSA